MDLVQLHLETIDFLNASEDSYIVSAYDIFVLSVLNEAHRHEH